MKLLKIALILAAVAAPLGLRAESHENKQELVPLSGQCHCGQVEYEITGPIIRSSTCDCRGCQRATGTLKAPFVVCRQPDFKITSGELKEFDAEGGERCDWHGAWHFCGQCGTQIFWKPHKGDFLDVFAGTLDDPSVFKPGN